MDETYILVELRRNNFFLDLQVPYTEASEKRLQELLFGWVGVNAVAGTVYNDQRQATGRIFYANSGDDFRQLSPRESIRSDGPRFAIEELMQRDRPHNWVVNTSGLVTSVSGGELYLRGETASLKVSYTHADEVSLGDTVNIDGVITPGPISPAFRARNVTVVGKGNTPEPTQLEKVSGLIDTRRNYDLVEVDATLVEIGQSFSAGSRFRDTEMQTQLLCRADGRLFEARLPIGVQLDQDLRVGAELRLSGICHLIRNAELRWRLEVDGFWIQLRDGHDIKVLAAAPWWTAARLLWVMGGILVVLALFLVWVLLLQKTVEKQTAIIGEKVEHETILNERQRMARELHDNLDQGLTGAAIQLQASRKFLEKSGGRQVESVEAALAQVGDAELSAVLNEHIELLKEDATKSQSVLKSVQAMLSHCGEESRTSILELRGGLLERMDLPSALKEEMGPLAEESGAQTNVEIVGTPRRLKLKAERNLLMVAREAATNAARHAQPSRIDVTLRFDSDAVSLVISDDGAGFATSESHKAGHFGLRGMQERINRLNGKIDIESKLGVGTEIRIILSPINEWELDPA